MTRARDLANFVSNAQGDVRFDTDTLFIDSSANSIGIGNTAPSRPLHITANPAMIMLEDSDGGSNDKKAQIQVDSGAFEVNARNDDDSSRTDNILVADLGTGNIGIGTNTPSTILTLKRDSAGTSAGDYVLLDLDNGNASGFSQIRFSDDGTEQASIFTQNSVQDMIFRAGGANERMRLLSGGGLTFNGDTAAANALDDYEEGFHEMFSGISTSQVINSSYTHMKYTKIGQMVFCSGYFNLSSATSSTTTWQISLPFTCTGVSNSAHGSVGGPSPMHEYLNLSSGYIDVNWYIASGGALARLYESRDNNSWSFLKENDFTTSTSLYFNFNYRTDS